MQSIIVTDNRATAERRFPDAKVVSTLEDVLKLKDLTTVRICEVKTGVIVDGPCHAARVLIRYGKLIEDCEK